MFAITVLRPIEACPLSSADFKSLEYVHVVVGDQSSYIFVGKLENRLADFPNDVIGNPVISHV